MDHDDLPLSAGMDLEAMGFEYVEQGVRGLVEVLWKLGYRTVSSCAGHTHKLEPYPNVAIPIDSVDNMAALEKLLRAVARYNLSLGKDGFLPPALDTWVIVPVNTPSGFTVFLQPYDNNQRKGKARIRKLRKASNGLALFMQEKCADIFGAN